MKANQPLSKEAQDRLLDWKDDMHPCLLPSFYETIDCPQNNQEAELLSKCHLDAVSDIDLQIETVDLDIEMLRNQIDVSQSSEEKSDMMKRVWDMQDKKRRLLYAKRRHTSSSNAYWYFMQ